MHILVSTPVLALALAAGLPGTAPATQAPAAQAPAARPLPPGAVEGYRAAPLAAPILVSLGDPGTGGRAVARASAAGELRALAARWPEALARRDLAFFDQLLADDYLGLGGPAPETKAGFITALARSAPSRDAAFRIDSLQIRILGSDDGLAVMSGSLTDRDPRTGEFTGPRVMFTEVLERRQGRWQVVHGHLSWIRS
ncbi:MAG TPA: DUF4440 domain-containing protein [Gemmatimonadales bacterium]|nr:DUF4440 domain-containing protein [Gemmatimonadales bacterium]